MPSSKPSLALLRELSDATVLAAFISAEPITRAELAVTTGLSKPTVAAAIKRLEEQGLVRDTGERTSGRGGVGTYYALTADVGVALAISIAPEGIVAEVVDVGGERVSRAVEPVSRPAPPATVARLLAKAVTAAAGGIGRERIRAAAVSAADPVDRTSGALVHLPDAPFLLGALSPVTTLRPLVAGAIVVDNDVNWAARSERTTRHSLGRSAVDDFVYLHLGEGLGCAVVSDGQIRRGHDGLTGEIAHVLTTGTDCRATTFTSVFAQLDLRRPDSYAIDVERLLARLGTPGGRELAGHLAQAICGVLSAAVAFANPGTVIIGGTWGTNDVVLTAVRSRAAQLPRPIPVERALATGTPSLAGARDAAVTALRTDLLGRATALEADA